MDQQNTSSQEQVATHNPEVPSLDEGNLLSKDELLSLISPKKQNKKPVIIAAILTLLAVLGLLWWYQSNNTKSASQSVSALRRYTVTKGDVTVGSNESSSISLSRESVTFPVSSTVAEVFVKSGSSVKEGDPLMRLNLDDISAGMVSYELQLKMAKLELDQAKLDQQSKLVKARQTYDAAVLQGEISATNQALSVQQLETMLVSAEKSLSDALEKLHTYRDYSKNYDDDYSNLTYYTKVYKDYKSTYENLQKSYSRAQELENSLIPGARENYEISKNKDIADGRDEDNPSSSTTYWLEKITSYEEELTNLYITTSTSSLTDLNKSVENAYSNYQTAYNRYRSYYTDFYEDYDGLFFDNEDALADEITSLKSKVESYSLSLEQAKLSQQTGTLTAEQSAELSAMAADTALAQYNLTVTQLSQSLDEKQEVYDQTVRQINEIRQSLSDDGIIYSPVRGMVTNIALSEGDSFKVTYDKDTDTLHKKTLLTITDISSVFVPITISEEDILNVSIGQQASVTMNAFEGHSFDAEVDSISVEAARSGAATVSYTVNIRYLGTNTLDMFEGMSANVNLIQKAVKDVLYVSVQAVTNKNGITTVQRQTTDGSETIEVTTGFSNGQYVEILSGLAEGDVLVAASGVSRA